MAFRVERRFLDADPNHFDPDSPRTLRPRPTQAPIVRTANAPPVGDLPGGLPAIAPLGALVELRAADASVYYRGSGTAWSEEMRIPRNQSAPYSASFTNVTEVIADHERTAKRPPVVVTDAAGRVMSGQVAYTSDTRVVVTFNNPVTGRIEVG